MAKRYETRGFRRSSLQPVASYCRRVKRCQCVSVNGGESSGPRRRVDCDSTGRLFRWSAVISAPIRNGVSEREIEKSWEGEKTSREGEIEKERTRAMHLARNIYIIRRLNPFPMSLSRHMSVPTRTTVAATGACWFGLFWVSAARDLDTLMIH